MYENRNTKGAIKVGAGG